MKNLNSDYDYCQDCGEFENSGCLTGIDDRNRGEIFICPDCTELYISENWPICFIAGYELKINA